MRTQYSNGDLETDSGIIRHGYAWRHQRIVNVKQLSATIRAGAYAWPGGYPLFFITDDGTALSFDTAKSEFSNIAGSIKHGISDGWRIVGCDINYEDTNLIDDHTGKHIESAYGDDDVNWPNSEYEYENELHRKTY